jgi:hypothetical protein
MQFRTTGLLLAGLAHDAGQSAYDLFKNYPQSPT